MEKDTLVAPFPYFGGKSTIADEIWNVLGDVDHYIEPFFGSGAVLLNRPKVGGSETVNDKDGFLCNAWRSLQFSPDEVAKWCDWPVNHADLSARKMKLIEKEGYLIENLIKDDTWHDPKLAGYWIWAASCWIGSGLTGLGQIPHLGDGGKGVYKIGKRPHLGDAGNGVHKIGKIPNLSNAGKGVQEPYNANLYKWFRELSERLRYVRVVCGDWKRVCGGNWQDNMGICGMYFDPPYGVRDRYTDIYHHDSTEIAEEVERWCLERGNLKTYRIVVSGYDEYKGLENAGWRIKTWKAGGGYGKLGDGQGRENRKRERLYISPHCLQDELF
jgi:DNA adenine methylase